MSAELGVLITLGAYAFIVLLVYFVLCLIDDDEIGNIGTAVCWPIFIIVGVVYAPFWMVHKSAEYVRRSMEKNKEDDDA